MPVVYGLKDASVEDVEEFLDLLACAKKDDTIVINREFHKLDVDLFNRDYLRYEAWSKNPIIRLLSFIFK